MRRAYRFFWGEEAEYSGCRTRGQLLPWRWRGRRGRRSVNICDSELPPPLPEVRPSPLAPPWVGGARWSGVMSPPSCVQSVALEVKIEAHSLNKFFSSGVFANTRSQRVLQRAVRVGKSHHLHGARCVDAYSAAETRMPALRAACRNWRSGSLVCITLAADRPPTPRLLGQGGELLVGDLGYRPRISAGTFRTCHAPCRCPVLRRAAGPARAPNRSFR